VWVPKSDLRREPRSQGQEKSCHVRGDEWKFATVLLISKLFLNKEDRGGETPHHCYKRNPGGKKREPSRGVGKEMKAADLEAEKKKIGTRLFIFVRDERESVSQSETPANRVEERKR